jgi:hypothetical protein
MDTIIYIILFIVTGGAVTATEVRVYRTACLAASASRQRQIADAHTVYLSHLADGLRDNLTLDDVRFLRINGWEPVTLQHRQLARGVSPDRALARREATTTSTTSGDGPSTP